MAFISTAIGHFEEQNPSLDLIEFERFSLRHTVKQMRILSTRRFCFHFCEVIITFGQKFRNLGNRNLK